MDAGVLRCTHCVQLVVAVGDPHVGCRLQRAVCRFALHGPGGSCGIYHCRNDRRGLLGCHSRFDVGGHAAVLRGGSEEQRLVRGIDCLRMRGTAPLAAVSHHPRPHRFASVQQPTRIVSWAKESLPDQMRARIPPAVSTVEKDERYAGAVVLFLLALASWVLSSTVGLMPLIIVSAVIGVYYCIPALMKRRGLRISAPKQLELLLTQVDTVICNKVPPQLRCARTLETLHCGTLSIHSLYTLETLRGGTLQTLYIRSVSCTWRARN